jgi:multidrug resistance efflux pump
MKWKQRLRRSARVLATLVIVVAACVLGWWVWQHYRYQPWTRDGRVEAKVVNIAPRVSGTVVKLAVHENQFVHKSDLLFKIDPRRYRHAKAQAKATLEKNLHAMRHAERQAERRKRLSNNAISKEKREQAIAKAAEAKAAYHAAQAKYKQAKLNLKWTTARAPANGYVTHLLLSNGDYVKQGQQAVTLVDSQTFHVTGYFQETKLARIHVGDEAKIELMTGWPALHGHVNSIGRGIAVSNNSSGERHLPKVNPVFQWVRLAQRIPVHIHIDKIPKQVHLSVGMTATITIKQHKKRESDKKSP